MQNTTLTAGYKKKLWQGPVLLTIKELKHSGRVVEHKVVLILAHKHLTSLKLITFLLVSTFKLIKISFTQLKNASFMSTLQNFLWAGNILFYSKNALNSTF